MATNRLLTSILLLVLIAGGCALDSEPLAPSTDGFIADVEPDGGVEDAYVFPPPVVPDLGEHKCSPAGHYTFNVTVTYTTCPYTIIKKDYWTNSAYMKSVFCGLYFMDAYAFMDDGIFYCAYWTDAQPEGLKQWAECTLIKDGKDYCTFHFSAPFTVPDR